MISVSQEVIDLINADSRTFRAKFKHGDSVYDKIMSLKWNVCLPSSSFSVGNALSIGIQCTAFDVPVSIKGEELELVITIEGSADEISIGSFTAEKPTIQNGIVSFNAYDDMSRAGNIPYNSTLGEGKHTVNQYVADVAETLGIGYISLGSEGEVTVENDYFSGNSCRNALAYLAGYLGRNCVIKNKKISMKKFTLVDYTMNADRIEEPELEDIDSEIDFIIAQISSNNTIMNGNGATGTELVCPIMTESQLSNVANMLFGDASPVKTYRSGKVKLLLGDPRLELCDVIKLDYKDTEYIIPITSISFEYDGGLMTDLEAYTLKEPTLLTPSQRLDFAVQEEVKKVLEQLKNIDGIYFYIRYSPNADGSNMTEEPDDKTEYIGVCSTNQSSAPGEASAYTWSKFKGKDGSSNFFHVKYSNDGGKTFTDTNGETAGEYIGILVDSNEDDSTNPSDYTWSKIVGNDGRGVSKVETEYRLSTSDTSLSSGYTWGTDAPTWQDGLFLWTRLVTYYTDGTNTPSDPVVDASWKKTSVVDSASKELNETLANALGLHVTDYPVAGGTIRYYHSNKTLQSSAAGDTIIIFNANGFGVCKTGWNNGNPQFTYGATFDGKAVWDILTANKISADLIEAGSIKSLSTAKVQTTINLDDGTISSTDGETSVKIQGGYTDDNGVTYPAGIALKSEIEDRRFMLTPSEFSFTTIEYLLALFLYEINPSRNPKPEDPYFSSVKEKDIKTTNLHCKNIYLLDVNSDEEFNLFDPLSMLSEQVNLLSESLTALQEKYLVLEEALGQQHEHTYVSSVTKQPTCTEQGTRKYTCSVCGSSYTENISATGHTDSNGDGYCDTCGTAVGTFYTITANPNNTNYGTVTGGGSYLSGNTATLTATAKTGYRFVQWTDGNTNATRTVTVTASKTYTAVFAVVSTTYTISANVSPAGAGTVTGDGTYESGSKASLTATPNSGYKFSHWLLSGNELKSNPLSITADANYEVTAVFEAEAVEELTISAGETKTVDVGTDNAGGLSDCTADDFTLIKFVPSVTGNYTVESIACTGTDDTCGCLFDSTKTNKYISDDSGGENGHFKFTYNCTAGVIYYIGAKFWATNCGGTIDVKVSYNGSSGGGSTETKQITVYCGDGTEIKRNGVVVHDSNSSYSGAFNYGDEITLTYKPGSGYKFAAWLDYETYDYISYDNPYTFTVGASTPAEIGAAVDNV